MSAEPKRIARGFEAGRTGRRLRAIPSTAMAINTQVRTYGRTLVARSRYLAINNPYASLAKEEYVSAMIGCGIKPASLVEDKDVKEEIQKAFRLWTDEADADGLTDYYGMQSIIASELFEAGECFVRLRSRFASDGLTVPLQLQILPSEMLPTEHNETTAGGTRIECGIEFDAIGKRVAYHFLRNHPGEAVQQKITASMRVRVPAEEVLHLFKPIRAGQIRGVPHTLSAIITLAMLDLYDDAELERKRIAALFGAFVTRPLGQAAEEHPFAGTPTADNETNLGASDFTLEPGAVVDLMEGQDIKFGEPADVGPNYEAYQYRMLLRAAAGFGVTYAGMTGDLRQTSYSSDRSGLTRFRRRIESQQHAIMVFQFCRPVWARWFEDAVRVGALPSVPMAGYMAEPRVWRDAKHVPPAWEWVDPLSDIQAHKLAVDSGFKARSSVILLSGEDPEEVDAQIAQDQERASGLNIKFIQLPSSVIVAPDDSETLVDRPVTPRVPEDNKSSNSDTEDDDDFGQDPGL